MLEVVLAIPFWLELVATLTGAISGAMHGVEHGYDLFGVAALAIVTGLAGGIVRDILLLDYGIYAFQRPALILTCMGAALVVFFFCRLFERLDLAIDIVDTVSIALWAVIGAGKGLSAGYSILPATILGTITAVGGGCMRDILTMREPLIFKAGTPYASAAFLGALVFSIMKYQGWLVDWAPFIGEALIMAVRFGAEALHYKTSAAHDYSDKVEDLASSVGRHFKRKD
ncbi:MAG: TRIC cation channel family protein [Coriobacteriales bacterium]|nr:TRIC cation channel family protein [Coriobacteriales bacterium]